MKKILCLLVLVLGVVGCSNSVLSDDYDEATLKSSAQKVLEQLNAGEYQAITDSVSLDLQNDLQTLISEVYHNRIIENEIIYSITKDEFFKIK